MLLSVTVSYRGMGGNADVAQSSGVKRYIGEGKLNSDWVVYTQNLISHKSKSWSFLC